LDAVRERYFSAREDRQQLVEEIIGMALPVEDWSITEQDIAGAHDAGLP
jgi:hypothetical protein